MHKSLLSLPITVMSISVTPEMPFTKAAPLWFESHKPYIKRNTVRVYVQYIRRLGEFFGELPLRDFTIGHVRSFQTWRKEKAGATRINAELSALQQVLKEVNLWRHIEPLYRPLPIPKTKVRKNMSPEEERRLIAVALDASKPRRLLAGHCLIVMMNTSMGFGELRHVKRGDVSFTDDPPFVTVNEGSKNDYRIRTIPLNFLALRSMKWIVRRWESLGGQLSEQYILPHHARRLPEEQEAAGHKRTQPPLFDEPMGHIYRAARSILKEAGLGHLDPYDMRSHACTKLLSDPTVSDQVYEETTGHRGQAMRRRYSKQRLDRKKTALDGLCVGLVEDTQTPSAPAMVESLMRVIVEQFGITHEQMTEAMGMSQARMIQPSGKVLLFPSTRPHVLRG
jgi:integrase